MNLRHLLYPLLIVALPAHFAAADGLEDPTETWAINSGGKLYDNWAHELLRDLPKETHPSYPKAGKKSGSATWRCKECHGWDYKGSDGAYGKGSHYTGIKGIRSLVGKPVETIKSIIRDDTHRYSETMIPDRALDNLALFISRGQVDMDQYIDRASRRPHGDAKRGARFYQTICAICHGFDGKQINFKAGKPVPEYIGTVANANPWETLHKIRNGQPGIPMVALGVLDIQDQLDILAYAQTLPKE